MYVAVEKKEKLSLNYPQYRSYLDFWKNLVQARAVFIPVPHPFCLSKFNYPQKTVLSRSLSAHMALYCKSTA